MDSIIWQFVRLFVKHQLGGMPGVMLVIFVFIAFKIRGSDRRLEWLVFLWGAPGTGKSTLVKFLVRWGIRSSWSGSRT
jgi:Cdc6-like AAA superfamily ATPase